MITDETKNKSLKELDIWLNTISYSEARNIEGNLFKASSLPNGNVAIITINRESYQPSVNCVKRDKFEYHMSQAKQTKCKSLYYVMYLRGNKLQVIIPETAVKSFFSDLSKEWYTISMNPADFGKHRKNNIIIKQL